MVATSILALFSITALTAALDIRQCIIGRHHGYLGSPLANTPNHGDVVTQSYCYCQKPKDQRTQDPKDKDLGSIIQLEYYNKDDDTSYALCQRNKCRHSDFEAQVNDCFMKEDETGITSNLINWFGQKEWLQRTWTVIVNPRIEDHFLFMPNTQACNKGPARRANCMTFNRVRRNLGPAGGQGYRKIENGMQDVCEVQCKEFLAMEVATNNGTTQPSFQILNLIDNICPPSGCRDYSKVASG